MSKKIKVLELIDGQLGAVSLDCNPITNPNFQEDVKQFLDENVDKFSTIVTGKVANWLLLKLAGYNDGSPVFIKRDDEGKAVAEYPIVTTTWIHNNLLVLTSDKAKEPNIYILLENYHG